MDTMEGVITNVPSKVLYSTDEKKTYKLLCDAPLISWINSSILGYCPLFSVDWMCLGA